MKYGIISDTHITSNTKKDQILLLIDQLNGIFKDVDKIIHAGDVCELFFLDELKNINSKYGTYYIVGNHEYFHGIEEIISKVKSLGIKVLENENIYIGEEDSGFNLAGVYDLFGYRAKKYFLRTTSTI